MRKTPFLLLSLILLAAPAPSAAQERFVVRGIAGGDFLLAFPVGEFEENVDFGFGIGVHGLLPLDDEGVFSLRADLGFLNYGNETIRICVTQPCRVTGDLSTSNNIFLFGVGPELAFGREAVRLYANASIGMAYFNTSSSVSGEGNLGDPFASSTNFDDLTFAWTLGTGAQLRVWSGDTTSVLVDLGARYHGNGEARYLRKGDIHDLPDGSVELDPQESETNLWTLMLGASVQIGTGPGPF